MSSRDQEDRVFKALGAGVRRAILDDLKDQPRTTGDLCARFDMLDRCTVMQHLKVLEEADLVIAQRKGRERWNHLNPLPIKHIHDRWIGDYAKSAVNLLDRLKSDLEADNSSPRLRGEGDRSPQASGGGGSSGTPFQNARRLRRTMSPPEIKLWQYLRTRPNGFAFRRQHPLSPYVVDFFCRAAALAIEVDGDAHDMGNNPERDVQRDAHLAKRGIRTLRFAAADVMKDLDAVAAQILEECASRTPSTGLRRSPSPRNRGEES